MTATFFWVFVAFLAGLAARALRLPTLVGYLAAGLVLALFGVESTSLLDAIADLGVLLLLFTLGLHLQLRSMLRPEVLGVGTLHLLLSVALFTGVLFLLGLDPVPALLLAAALGFSSTVLTAKSLEARDDLDSYHGRIAIGILIVQDVVAVALLAFSGTAVPSIWAVGLLGLPLLRPLLFRVLDWGGHEELLIVFGLFVALATGALFDLVGLSDKLGALVVGIMLGTHSRSDELYDQLWGMKEVFLVGFFLQVGLAGLPEPAGWLTIGLLMLLLPLKGVGFFLLLLFFRLRGRTAFLTAVALTAYSEFALIVAVAFADAGLLPASWVVILALLAAFSFALNAPLSRAANRLWLRLEKPLSRLERPGEHPDHLPRSLGKAGHLIIGMGRAGTAAYETLTGDGERVLGMDNDPERIRQHLGDGRRVIYGDANDPELWEAASIDGLRSVILTLANVNAKARAARLLREQGYQGPISALLRRSEDAQLLRRAGIVTIGLPMIEVGRDLARENLRLVGEQQGDLS